jgi:pilus assembly protein Flp/PilA
MKSFLTSLRRDTRGATAIEYGLICGLIVITIIVAVQGVGGQNGGMWGGVATKASTAMSGAD